MEREIGRQRDGWKERESKRTGGGGVGGGEEQRNWPEPGQAQSPAWPAWQCGHTSSAWANLPTGIPAPFSVCRPALSLPGGVSEVWEGGTTPAAGGHTLLLLPEVGPAVGLGWARCGSVAGLFVGSLGDVTNVTCGCEKPGYSRRSRYPCCSRLLVSKHSHS